MKFITHIQALELKQLGFDEPCLKVGNPNGHILWKFMDVLDVEGVDIGDIMKEKFDDRFVEIPLKQQVFRWFREKYELHGYIEGMYPWCRYYINSQDDRWEGHKYDTYEECENDLINKLIEVVKNK